MRHPEIFLVPALMIADYLLTIAGARLREGAYARHFATQQYELNPIWQRAVAKGRWLNLRHLAIVLAVTLLLISLDWLAGDDELMLPLIIGLFIGAFGTVNGRHLANLAIFAWLERHPDEIEGRVAMSHSLVLHFSTFQVLCVLLPLALLAAYVPEPGVVGAAAGALLVLATHVGWIRRHRRALRDRAETDGTERAGPVSPEIRADASPDAAITGTDDPH